MEKFGIDISSYQNNINIKSIKNSVSFIILRAGFTGWGGDGTGKNKDNCFERFYQDCKNNGIPVGCYWFSCANTYDKGKSEAEYLYENCLKGKQFEYPIYIDVEDAHHQQGNKRGVTDAIKGFCDYLEAKRYYVGVYGSDISTFQDKVYLDELNRYDKWVARYGAKPKYVTNYQMWQNSESGRINGYNEQVDTDYVYIDYPAIIKGKGFNGYTAEPAPQPTPVNPLDQYTDQQLAVMVLEGKFGNGGDRKKALGDRYDSVQKIVNEIVYGSIKVGTKVKTIAEGNGASDGSSNKARAGLIGRVTKIKDGAKYPYLVEDYGWYKRDGLQII